MTLYIRNSLQTNMAPIADDVMVDAACLSTKGNLIVTTEPAKRRGASRITIDAANLIEAAGLAILGHKLIKGIPLASEM